MNDLIIAYKGVRALQAIEHYLRVDGTPEWIVERREKQVLRFCDNSRIRGLSFRSDIHEFDKELALARSEWRGRGVPLNFCILVDIKEFISFSDQIRASTMSLSKEDDGSDLSVYVLLMTDSDPLRSEEFKEIERAFTEIGTCSPYVLLFSAVDANRTKHSDLDVHEAIALFLQLVSSVAAESLKKAFPTGINPTRKSSDCTDGMSVQFRSVDIHGIQVPINKYLGYSFRSALLEFNRATEAPVDKKSESYSCLRKVLRLDSNQQQSNDDVGTDFLGSFHIEEECDFLQVNKRIVPGIEGRIPGASISPKQKKNYPPDPSKLIDLIKEYWRTYHKCKARVFEAMDVEAIDFGILTTEIKKEMVDFEFPSTLASDPKNSAGVWKVLRDLAKEAQDRYLEGIKSIKDKLESCINRRCTPETTTLAIEKNYKPAYKRYQDLLNARTPLPTLALLVFSIILVFYISSSVKMFGFVTPPLSGVGVYLGSLLDWKIFPVPLGSLRITASAIALWAVLFATGAMFVVILHLLEKARIRKALIVAESSLMKDVLEPLEQFFYDVIRSKRWERQIHDFGNWAKFYGKGQEYWTKLKRAFDGIADRTRTELTEYFGVTFELDKTLRLPKREIQPGKRRLSLYDQKLAMEPWWGEDFSPLAAIAEKWLSVALKPFTRSEPEDMLSNEFNLQYLKDIPGKGAIEQRFWKELSDRFNQLFGESIRAFLKAELTPLYPQWGGRATNFIFLPKSGLLKDEIEKDIDENENNPKLERTCLNLLTNDFCILIKVSDILPSTYEGKNLKPFGREA